jgi:hypothetical protein
MNARVAPSQVTSKHRASQIRNQNSRIGNPISPVMQKVKSLLPPGKAAQTLAFLIDEPLGSCQKLLCGERSENAEVLAKLLCTEAYGIGEAVLLVIGEGRKVRYIEVVRRRANVAALKKQIAAAQALIASAMQEDA